MGRNVKTGVISGIRIFFAFILVIVLIGFLFIGFLTIREYKPKEAEPLETTGTASEQMNLGQDYTVMTWNIGYGALDETADFFMDGGKQVSSATAAEVNANVAAFAGQIQAEDADIVFLQEVDTNSGRSHHKNEKDMILESLVEYQGAMAYNFKVDFIPYPIPPIGQVNSGIVSLSRFEMEDATRVALPCPFAYPVRIGNLKRCLLVSRVAIEGTDAELVLINLHLEAYDDGEGKIAQTKQLRELIEGEVAAGNYVIAGGDFNQVFSDVDTSVCPVVSDSYWQPGVIDMTEFEGSTFYTGSNAPTCRSLDKPLVDADLDNFQFYIIDGFIVSNNITVNSYETRDLGFKNSDHNPVVLNFTLN